MAKYNPNTNKNNNMSNNSRRVPPFFTSGFKAMQSGEIMIVDFVTAFPGEGQHVFSSVAMTKDIAENLVKALSGFVEEIDDGED